ncbi:MAG: hypothetical protein AAF409_11780 [Pseudomonadota bacterium]
MEVLLDPSTHLGALVDQLQSYISHVVHAGEHAYQMKMDVCLPFVDFSQMLA